MKQTLRQSKYIEDTLNDVFARHMPELHEQEELGEDVYLPPSYPRPFVEPRKEIWMDDELGKADPKVQKRLTEIMLTRKVKPKGETK